MIYFFFFLYSLIEPPQVIAHRGFSGQHPENTMISFEKAVEAGTDALEGDIRLSKDGELVMMHDLTLQRTTTGTGNVGDHPWYGYIDGLKTKAEPAQPIPRLNDVFDLLVRPEVASNEQLYMIVDIKFDNPIEILDRLYALLEEYKEYASLQRQVVIGVWHHDFLDRTRELFGDTYKICFIGLSLVGARRKFLEQVDCLSVPFAALADEDGQQFIREAHDLGKRVFTWTINDVEQMVCAVAWGLDGIVGDHVDVMVEHMHHQVMSYSHEEYISYLDASTHLKHRRTRWYYYCVKKAMQWGSATYIGV
ncbi:PLC-like phosphodiesterase [Halteromyces radiatus]|uniref:PLC-like phosphodiesterase n=1 Tax=Halteromyces radiatus TaxID=101107 RepID=UPI00221EA6F8|nr:PLC-like phosphodiesterase [Halteromyces radiatus]KAI8078643.1 PLC-like phosphodiesterase [Halteromyces radiatus]